MALNIRYYDVVRVNKATFANPLALKIKPGVFLGIRIMILIFKNSHRELSRCNKSIFIKG